MKTVIQFQYYLFIAFAFLSFQVISQEPVEMKNEGEQRVYHLDSIGNIISFKRQLELMRTSEYISIPFVNGFDEVEHLIRKRDPNNPEDAKYQVYTNGNMVINSFNTPTFNPRLSIGDTLENICGQNVDSIKICIGQSKRNPNSVLMVVNISSWGQIKQELTSLIRYNSTTDFLLIPSIPGKSLDDFFSSNFLKNTGNIYLVEKDTEGFSFDTKAYPTYYITNKEGKITLMVPPLPKQSIANAAIQKFINATKREEMP